MNSRLSKSRSVHTYGVKYIHVFARHCKCLNKNEFIPGINSTKIDALPFYLLNIQDNNLYLGQPSVIFSATILLSHCKNESTFLANKSYCKAFISGLSD